MRRRQALPLALLAAVLGTGGVAHAGTSGELAVRHSDDFVRDRTVTQYDLVQGKRRVRIDPKRALDIRGGTPVVVDGKRRGGVITGAAVRPTGTRSARVTAGALGSYRVAVVLVNFSSDTREPWTTTQVTDRFFGASDSVAAYYGEQSWGRVDVSGDVYGWLTVDATPAGCNVDAIAAAARSAASDQGISLGAYDSVGYVFPRLPACGWAGLAELPGSQFWPNGDLSTRVAAHELGHNMGVHHAGSLNCRANGAAVAISPTCTLDEYGDPFDVMGSRTRRMGGWHLQQLGYTNDGNVTTISADGTYTLRSTLGVSADAQVLRIPRQPLTSPREYYYLDLREAGGAFDTFGASDPAVNGVTLRVGNDANVLRQSQLIDTTPGSSRGFQDAPLAAGREFSDGTVSVRVQSVAGGVATVEVSFAGTPPDIYPPSRPGEIALSSDTQGIDLNWAPSSDNFGVAGYRVIRDNDVIATVVAPSYRDTTAVPQQGYTYTVEAFDAAGNTTQSSRSAAVALAQPAATPPPTYEPPTENTTGDGDNGDGDDDEWDDTAPRLRFRSPGSGQKLRKRTVIKATASDAAGEIERFELWVDGKRRTVVRRERIDWAWALRKVKPGRHTLKLVATDDSGNTARKTLRVRVIG